MQVTHIQDQETHAVVGGSEVMSFGIAQTAEFFTVLSSTLYSDKELAVIRETLCNAWDAHIAAGKVSVPILITIDENHLIIRDYGLGIPHHLIHPIYCVYGNSTKKNDGKQTGGFGLGSKAPFAYTEHFTVTSCHGGTRTVYAASRGSPLTEGRPDMRVMVKTPTTETGLELSIPIKNPEDVSHFTKLIKQVVSYGEMNVLLNGVELDRLPISAAENGVYITSQIVPMYPSNNLFIRYGNVIYPIEQNDAYIDEFRKAIDIISKIPGVNNSYSHRPWSVILQADANTIAVTPSRESLNLSDITILTIKSLLNKITVYAINSKTIIDKLIELENKKIDYLYSIGRPLDTLNINNLNYRHNERREAHYEILNLKEYYGYLSNVINFPGNKELKTRSLINKLQLISIGQRSPRTNAYKKFLKVIRFTKNWELERYGYENYSTPKKLYHNILFNKLISNIYKSNLITHNNVYIYQYEFRNGIRPIKTITKDNRGRDSLDFDDYLNLLKRVVVLAPSRLDFENRIILQDYIITSHDAFFACTYKPGTKDKVKQWWLDQGYHVVDNVDKFLKEKEELTQHYLLRNPEPVKLPKIKKPEGYPKLSSLFNNHGFFSLNEYKTKMSNTLDRITKPRAVIQGFNISNSWDTRFFEFGDNAAGSIKELFNNEIGIVVNKLQYNNAIKDGAVDYIPFIFERLFDYLNNSNTIKDNLIMDNIEVSNGSVISFNALIDIGKHNTLIRTKYKLPDGLSDLDKEYLNIYQLLKERIGGSSCNDGCKKLFNDYKLEFEKQLDFNKFNYLKLLIEKNKETLYAIDLHRISVQFEKGVSIELKVFLETTIISALRL